MRSNTCRRPLPRPTRSDALGKVRREQIRELRKPDPTEPRRPSKRFDTNGADILAVKRRTGTSGGNPVWTTIASYAYGSGAPPHQPSSVTDSAGQTTQYTYSSTTGQVLTITNAKSEVTTFAYETNTSSAAYGRLLSISGDDWRGCRRGGGGSRGICCFRRRGTDLPSQSGLSRWDHELYQGGLRTRRASGPCARLRGGAELLREGALRRSAGG
jgi:hypothetical protein